jgi:hypothetical protein
MNWILETFIEFIRQGLIEAVLNRFETMYDSVNAQIGDIAVQVGSTPAEWNPAIFNMVRNLSELAVIPVAGMILTFVLCYELIQLLIEKNNMVEFDVMNIYKWILKTFAAVFILTNTFNLVMAVFALAQNVVNASAGIITGNLDVGEALEHLEEILQTMGAWELIGLWLQTFLVDLMIRIMTVVIFVIIFGRMIEIYLVVSVAPIPLATLTNREWGQIGTNYIKSLFALAFQAFLIMVCVAIYAALVQNIPSADNIHVSIWTVVGYTALLCFALLRTGSLSKQLFSAH